MYISYSIVSISSANYTSDARDTRIKSFPDWCNVLMIKVILHSLSPFVDNRSTSIGQWSAASVSRAANMSRNYSRLQIRGQMCQSVWFQCEQKSFQSSHSEHAGMQTVTLAYSTICHSHICTHIMDRTSVLQNTNESTACYNQSTVWKPQRFTFFKTPVLFFKNISWKLTHVLRE